MSTSRSEIELEIDRLKRGIESFESQVEALRPGEFLGHLGAWSPRDVVAHLIGWTRYAVTGSEQIRRGELPSYDLDPGEDYSNVNAQLVRNFPSKDPTKLLSELHEAATDLISYLHRLDAADWDRDFGVRHGHETLTVSGTIGELIDDFAHHARQLGELSQS